MWCGGSETCGTSVFASDLHMPVVLQGVGQIQTMSTTSLTTSATRKSEGINGHRCQSTLKTMDTLSQAVVCSS